MRDPFLKKGVSQTLYQKLSILKKTQGANLEFVQITVSLHQAKLGPPPFRQGRLIFLIFYDNNRHDFVLNLCLCIKKNIVVSASLA